MMNFEHCNFNFFFVGGSLLPAILIILCAVGVIPFSPLMLLPLAVPGLVNGIRTISRGRLTDRRLADWERDEWHEEFGFAPHHEPRVTGVELESDLIRIGKK